MVDYKIIKHGNEIFLEEINDHEQKIKQKS